jgi:hypothetical protein
MLQHNIKPIHVPVAVAAQITGESRARLYEAIKAGELDAFKAGTRTMLSYAQLEERCAARPNGLPKENPALAAARDAAAEARRKKIARKRNGR